MTAAPMIPMMKSKIRGGYFIRPIFVKILIFIKKYLYSDKIYGIINVYFILTVKGRIYYVGL